MTLTKDEITTANPSDFGYTIQKGKLDRSPVKRRNGDQALWETSSMYSNAQVYGDEKL